jgi:hippurate hydrolase
VSCTAGEITAGTDQLDVTFHGIGGHGSAPHLARDPVLMACTAVIQYQFIISRAIDPLHAAVITVGSVQAGADNNVIPPSALVKINLRWYDERDRLLMLDGIERINQSVAMAHNLPPELRPTTTMKGGAKVLSNDTGMVHTVTPALQSLLGERAVLGNTAKIMGSEDFHHLVAGNETHRCLYMFVGTAKPEHFRKARAEGKVVPYTNHNPDFRVDLDAIPLGAKIGASSVAALFAA